MTGDYFTGGEGGGRKNTSSLASSEIIQSNLANIKKLLWSIVIEDEDLD